MGEDKNIRRIKDKIRKRIKYKTNLSFRLSEIKRALLWNKKNKKRHNKNKAQWAKNKYNTDPEYREKIKKINRERYQKKMKKKIKRGDKLCRIKKLLEVFLNI